MRDFEDGERKEATIACRTEVGLCAETTYAITSCQRVGWGLGEEGERGTRRSLCGSDRDTRKNDV